MIPDLKQRILELASDLFMKQGYLMTSTRQIARTLNITQPALYHHFKNKETLYTQVVHEYALKIGTDLNLILTHNKTPQETLLEMVLILKEKYPMNFMMMMHDMKNEISKETQDYIYRIWFENFYSPFEQVFDRLKDNLKDSYNPSDITKHFLRIIQTYVSKQQQYVYETPLEIQEIINIFISGITK